MVYLTKTPLDSYSILQSNFAYNLSNLSFFNSLVNLIIEDNNQTRIQPRPSLTPILEQQAIDYLRSHSLKDALYDHSFFEHGCTWRYFCAEGAGVGGYISNER